MKDLLYFEPKDYTPSAISSSGYVCGKNCGNAEGLFLSVSSESFSLGYSAHSVSLYSVWLC